jgi:DNA-binding LacI/PurR family transcriptional regulator
MSVRLKPDKGQLEDWIEAGMSLRKIANITGWSVSSVSRFCEEYQIEKPSVGRPKGFKVTEETRKRMSQAIKKIAEELK